MLVDFGMVIKLLAIAKEENGEGRIKVTSNNDSKNAST